MEREEARRLLQVQIDALNEAILKKEAELIWMDAEVDYALNRLHQAENESEEMKDALDRMQADLRGL